MDESSANLKGDRGVLKSQDQDVRTSTFRHHDTNSENQDYDNDDTYERDSDRSMFNHRNTSSRNYRRVEFEESRNDNQNRTNEERHPNYAPSAQTDGNLKQNQIAARHVVDKKLPIFAGDPSEWPIWYHQCKNSTKLCGFTDGENLDRLQKCLKHKARDVVKGHLIHAESVPWIIRTLKMLYGRPEVIVTNQRTSTT